LIQREVCSGSIVAEVAPPDMSESTRSGHRRRENKWSSRHGEPIVRLTAFSGEVDTGSPENATKQYQTEHDPIQFERIML
jgi:hypothetical protein